MKALKALCISIAILFTTQVNSTPIQISADFYEELEEKFQIDRTTAEQILQNAQRSQDVLDAIARPWEAKPWFQYYPIFLTESRVANGIAFWQEHQDTLLRAEEEYGVPAEIILAILGVETSYGQIMGRHRVLDSLYTLAFHYPPRAQFFRSELQHFLALVAEEQLDPSTLNGSYAGAMGFGQFISSSYRAYAVDFDQDGQRDLLNNPVDAIGSVANYFARHNWQRNQPIITPAWPSSEHEFNTLISSRGTQLTHTVGEIQEHHVAFTTELTSNTRARLFKFEEAQGNASYWVGFQNFYAITRYNHSPLYAMVVFQLSERLRRQM
ncbi:MULTISPECIES: lytic murein transglycosylase B [Gammaproteobacteria]|uniref:lytic murein transglycosylase B n=1 Tax=Gammaproteobacteria TaxID=1236 RepID=UPI000DD0CA7B|nr:MULTISPECIES: lytic murein transglycosylase B [Gammaproteobacteria]RTE87457.1 lytic murein transglycosylase B [Aliidiomarina sp. B3213]TCZ92758.1 lytic murein transglycosylase B [Lysobacter sp. N42]